ncbi:transporter substrate-binding domain-containing protein [Roseateles amylovorans]|uniref:Transporter substrate-binding domain-containing protein n=1 Tax=Roseateles amylovorans TaxID=2978473 RepID=A0ABY6AYB4_9BURK|nr:transporter substrate-binding domain-containing protein [Roseateles amylovorans]UXH76293.1 transporter substrate-binding domain-containing protein [Roseateles amylovorans]
MAAVRAALPSDCTATAATLETLSRVLCLGELRVGIRGDYPPFGEATPDGPRGLEPALAGRIAEALGVRLRFVEVNAADRMVALGDGRVDLLIATTGHTLQRDSQAIFVRPHYYESRTVVVGQRKSMPHQARDLEALSGLTVCVTVGNSTNADLAVEGARLMLFSSARRLVDQVHNGTCALAAHDDTLLLPQLPASYEVKLSFAPLPWSVVVGRDGPVMARWLSRTMQRLHADGALLRLAEAHGVATPWLRQQQARWRSPPCDTPQTLDPVRCLDPPRDNQLVPTRIAGSVERLEQWLQERFGVDVTLAMLKTQVALRLFMEGVGYSIALVAGAVLATVVLALGFGAGLTARSRWLRWPMWATLLMMQSTPMVMFMAAAGMVLASLGWSTPGMAWGVAVIVLGLFNGSNAGQAVAEARQRLRADGHPGHLRTAAVRARAQIASFAANATRGSPVASLIGVPELLAAQTDIASFSSERVTTFALLLIFYMALVSGVVAVLQVVQGRLQRAENGR